MVEEKPGLYSWHMPYLKPLAFGEPVKVNTTSFSYQGFDLIELQVSIAFFRLEELDHFLCRSLRFGRSQKVI